MAVDRRQGALDLRSKLALEGPFLRRLASFHAIQSRTLAIQIETTGRPEVLAFTSDLERLLLAHYQRVTGVFKVRINRLLPESLRLTEEELERITSFLERLFAQRAIDQARVILATSRRDADRALTAARMDQQEQALAGVFLGSRDVAVNAASIYRRLLRRREAPIACLETQTAAETAKQVEAQILMGQDPLTHVELRAFGRYQLGRGRGQRG